MPDARLQRTRPTLPDGYQFGGARCQHDYRAQRWTVTELGAGFYTARCALCGHDAGIVNMLGVCVIEGITVPPEMVSRPGRFVVGRDLGDEA